MADTLESATPEELTAVIQEFEQYRERLVNDTLQAAQKAKVMKSIALAQLEPELAQIDAVLQGLRDRQSALATSIQA